MPEGFPNNSNGHLEKGVKPIMVCVGTLGELDDSLKSFRERIDTDPSSVVDIDYYGSMISQDKNFLTDGDGAYIISAIDGLDKISSGFMNCTGLIVCGIDKDSGENISFLTHQNSIQLFVYGWETDFVKDLKKRLNEIKDRCKPGTIDAIVVGGLLDSGYRSDEGAYKKDYLESLRLLSREVTQVLGLDPVVVNGPKIYSSDDWDNVYFLNKERNAYLVRSEVNQMRDFPAGEGSKIFNTGKKS